MNIGIDARLIHETGVGRYIRNLLTYLAVFDTENSYYIYVRSESVDEVRRLMPKANIRVSNIRWHTLKEQLFMPFVFGRDRLDVLHVPYFCIPIFYPGKLVVTIHDLIPLHVKTGKASTLPFPLFYLKRLFYRLVIVSGIQKAVIVIAVSNRTKKEIVEHFPHAEGKVRVISEGVDESLLLYRGKKLDNPIYDPFILYVGNVYPHKNVMTALQAFELAKKSLGKGVKPQCVLVGKNDAFTMNLMKDTLVKSDPSIRFLTDVNDRMLASLYSYASALVFPSDMEGFGLPALEAIAFGCPIILSDIPIFRELFSDVGLFVQARDIKGFSQYMVQALTKKIDRIASPVQDRYISKYRWQETARLTHLVYEDSYRI